MLGVEFRQAVVWGISAVGGIAVGYRRGKAGVAAVLHSVAFGHVGVTVHDPVMEAAKPVIFFVRLRYLIGVTCLTEVAAGCRRSLRDARVVQCGG